MLYAFLIKKSRQERLNLKLHIMSKIEYCKLHPYIRISEGVVKILNKSTRFPGNFLEVCGK